MHLPEYTLKVFSQNAGKIKGRFKYTPFFSHHITAHYENNESNSMTIKEWTVKK